MRAVRNELVIDDEDELLQMGDEPQYFFFKVGGDIYALEAESVREMVEFQAYTKVPLMHSYVKGVSNIRGEIVSVIDLLERFGLGSTKITKKSSMVLIGSIALIIDEVHEVNTIAPEDIKATLDFGFKIENRFIKNMARYKGSYIAILNSAEILNIKEISSYKETL